MDNNDPNKLLRFYLELADHTEGELPEGGADFLRALQSAGYLGDPVGVGLRVMLGMLEDMSTMATRLTVEQPQHAPEDATLRKIARLRRLAEELRDQAFERLKQAADSAPLTEPERADG